MTNPIQRIALFGGSFDPIHQGHLFIAQQAQISLGLDEVIFVPAFCSPFKKGTTSTAPAHRLAMTSLAIKPFPWATCSDYEVSLQETSYSWKTAEHFLHLYGGPDAVELFWILGADQWKSLPAWSRSAHLADLVQFIVFVRDGANIEPIAPFRSHTVEGTFNASSTDIRRRLSKGENDNLPLSKEIIDYISNNGLYSNL